MDHPDLGRQFYDLTLNERWQGKSLPPHRLRCFLGKFDDHHSVVSILLVET